MKTITKYDLDHFLGLSIIASLFLEVDKEFVCIHDDNEGNSDQCVKIILKENSSTEFLELHTPVSHGLRFRNYAGGGSSLKVHNALKVLIYASIKNEQLFLPGLEQEPSKEPVVLETINNILEGIIILPPEVFGSKKLHYFFNIVPNLTVAISVDGDIHIITEASTTIEKLKREKSTIWNPKPFCFNLKTNCSKQLYNALVLLAIAVKQSSN